MSETIVPTVLKSTFTTSDEIGQVTGALAAAHADFEKVIKDANNPFFKSKYADLAGVIEATGPALSKNKLAVIQSPRMVNGHVVVTTLLAHSSGEWIKDELELPLSKYDAQGAGSAITYARRYAYQAIVGVAAEDDDGNAASQKFEKQPDGSFAKPRPSTEPVQANSVAPPQANAAKKTGRPKKESDPSLNKNWAGEFEKSEPKSETKATSFNFGANQPESSPENIHGVKDLTNADVPFPGDEKKDRLATEEERKQFVERAKALKAKGAEGIGPWLLKKGNVRTTQEIPYGQMVAFLDELEAAEKAGKLKELLG